MALPCGTYNVSYKNDMAIIRTKFQWGITIAAVIICFLSPLFLSDYLLSFFIYVWITIIAALGLNLITGYCGQISVGHAAFMGVGAFAGAHLLNGGVPFLLALLGAGAIASLVGVIFGAPAVRVKGFYLALSTLAAQFIITYVIVRFFGGDMGVRMGAPEFFGITMTSLTSWWYLILVILILATFLTKGIARTKTGRAFIAIRDNDIAAEAMGINVPGYKLLAFVVGCFLAGIAGALWSCYLQLASVDHYTLLESIWFLGIVIIGGLGSVSGVFFGAIFIRGLHELTALAADQIGLIFPLIAGDILAGLPLLVFGIVLILFIILEPRGLAHRWGMFKNSYRLWPWGYW